MPVAGAAEQWPVGLATHNDSRRNNARWRRGGGSMPQPGRGGGSPSASEKHRLSNERRLGGLVGMHAICLYYGIRFPLGRRMYYFCQPFFSLVFSPFFTPELPLRTVNCSRHEDASRPPSRQSKRNANPPAPAPIPRRRCRRVA